jgi:glycosyltransferase involved in cell wall biosynthesis
MYNGGGHPLKTVVAFPSTAIFGQQVALAHFERNALKVFETTFHFESGHWTWDLMRRFKRLDSMLLPQLKRREISLVPKEMIHSNATLEIVRTIASKVGVGRVNTDRIWDFMSKDFTRSLASRLDQDVEAIYAYEYTALEAFKVAGDRGIVRILDFPSLNSREFQSIQLEQRKLYPSLCDPTDSYFDSVFERRQQRRDEEAALADIIITNSTVTRDSFLRAGVDPSKIFSVPYGAPEADPDFMEREPTGPLKVVWAGTFSVRKGAHLFLEAWNSFSGNTNITAEVYGAVDLGERAVSHLPSNLIFQGSVVRDELFRAFANADVLIFPTLSDGFGMVITEALSRGLPVITTRQAGASDFVSNLVNGLLIQEGDSNAIAEALHWCMDNRDKLNSMRAAAIESAKSWQWRDYRAALIHAIEQGTRGMHGGFQGK